MVKNMTVNVGDARAPDPSPELGRSLGGGIGRSLQDACLENSKDRRAWKTIHSSWSCEESNTTEHTHTNIKLAIRKT